MILTAENITKVIRGKTILDGISLEMHDGMVYGFVGRNACGKTMLFRALSGLMSVTEGQIKLDGRILYEDGAVLPGLGIIIENVGMYPEMTGYQNLAYLAGIRGSIGRAEIEEAMKRVGLDPADKRTYKKYSLGMKQRLAIAQAIMEKPGVIMLDEPTNALDREGVALVREVIQQEKQRGAMVLIASHNAEDIRLLADVVFEMENGRIIHSTEVNR